MESTKKSDNQSISRQQAKEHAEELKKSKKKLVVVGKVENGGPTQIKTTLSDKDSKPTK